MDTTPQDFFTRTSVPRRWRTPGLRRPAVPAPTPGFVSRKGGGISRLIEQGNVFERGGVNFSHVTSKLAAIGHRRTPSGSRRTRAWAMGVSLVLPWKIPYCPTAHMNVRCFVARDGERGRLVVRRRHGSDALLRFADDVRHFHATCKVAAGAIRRRPPCQVQNAGVTSTSSSGTERAARRRRPLLTT